MASARPPLVCCSGNLREYDAMMSPPKLVAMPKVPSPSETYGRRTPVDAACRPQTCNRRSDSSPALHAPRDVAEDGTRAADRPTYADLASASRNVQRADVRSENEVGDVVVVDECKEHPMLLYPSAGIEQRFLSDDKLNFVWSWLRDIDAHPLVAPELTPAVDFFMNLQSRVQPPSPPVQTVPAPSSIPGRCNLLPMQYLPPSPPPPQPQLTEQDVHGVTPVAARPQHAVPSNVCHLTLPAWQSIKPHTSTHGRRSGASSLPLWLSLQESQGTSHPELQELWQRTPAFASCWCASRKSVFSSLSGRLPPLAADGSSPAAPRLHFNGTSHGPSNTKLMPVSSGEAKALSGS